MTRVFQSRGKMTRRRILDAAAQEFALKGFDGGSMRAIARECAIEAPLIQYHFQDKLTLWAAVLDDVIGGFQSKVDEAMRAAADRRPSEQLAVYLETMICSAATDTIFVSIMSHARINMVPNTELFRQRIRRNSINIVDLIRAAQVDGEAVPGDPVVVFYAMVGAALRIFMAAAEVSDLAGGAKNVADLLDEHVRTCIGIFLRGMDNGVRATTLPKTSQTPPKSSVAESHLQPAFLLFANLDNVVRRTLEQSLKDVGITPAQMIALSAIANQPRLSSAQLARLLRVSPQTILLFVKALEDKGFIQRDDRWRKRRALPMEVTALGEAMLARLGGVLESADATLLDTFSNEERVALRGLLSRLLKQPDRNSQAD